MVKHSLSLRAKRSNPSFVKQPVVYILANKKNGTLYTGVTSNLIQRVWQHKQGIASGFASRFDCTKLVWFEVHDTMGAAISREKQLKGGPRAAKVALIMVGNPQWEDLYDGLI